MIVRSRAPYRIEFGGGATDIPVYSDEFSGCVVNAAINKYSYATLQPSANEIKINAEHKKTFLFKDFSSITYDGDLDLIKAVIKVMQPKINFEIFLRNDMAPNSGLGTNASGAVAAIGLLNHICEERKLNKYEIAELAYEISAKELGLSGGRQNQYASSFGGINLMEFKKGGVVRVSPLNMSQSQIMELQKHLLLVYAGRRTEADAAIRKQIESYSQKTEILHKLKDISMEMRRSLEKGDFRRFGELMNSAWQTKKELNPQITNHYIERIYDLALKTGAIGGRVIGAGSGGHMIFYCEPNKEHLVAKKLQENGAQVSEFGFDFNGLQTWEAGL